MAETKGRFFENFDIVQRLWAEETVDHSGEFFTIDKVQAKPQPF